MINGIKKQLGDGLVVQCVFSMYEALRSIPSMKRRRKRRLKRKKKKEVMGYGEEVLLHIV